jgi:lysyl-tRNA synthetase class 2
MRSRTEQEQVRFEKLNALREGGFSYPNDVKLDGTTKSVRESEPSDSPVRFTVAGRIVLMRDMGKVGFATISDAAGRCQIYLRKDELGEVAFGAFKNCDLGDIVEVKGFSFVTKTGEVTLHCESFRLLVKGLVPLPEKFHGLSDVEQRYRQRYLDLIVNEESRTVFRTRSRIIKEIRRFLDDRGYLEVETPVLHDIAGGADARPFTTHHNSLSQDMVLRIALELPLKKLVVGGFERVYELSRVFRNEGLSRKHNPEFTMLELYQAYATFHEMMDLTQDLYLRIANLVVGGCKIPWGEELLDLTPPWPRISMMDSIYDIGGIERGSVDLSDLTAVIQVAGAHHIELEDPRDWGRSLESLWGELVESKIRNPVFITHHPSSISPLSRKNDENPLVTDRFELIIAGMEMANAFSELNDPIDQRQRFEDQQSRAVAEGRSAALDEDFLRALEVGLPPTAGEGIGIDRLVMLFTNSSTIRDVVLFPQLKREE